MDFTDLKDTTINDTEAITDILFGLIYWIGVIIVILIVVYICFKVAAYLKKKREGITEEDDDFLD